MLSLRLRQADTKLEGLESLRISLKAELARIDDCFDSVHTDVSSVRNGVDALTDPNTLVRAAAHGGAVAEPVQKVADRCQSLYDRALQCCRVIADNAAPGDSTLDAALSTYRLAMQLLHAELARGVTVSRLRLENLRVKLDRLVALPLTAVTQFRADDYLAAHDDVRHALNSGQLFSALEHFATQGLYEARAGRRVSAGVDIDAIAPESLPPSPIGETSVTRSVIERSGLFDAAWYQKEYGKRRNPLKHYCKRGARKGLKPNPVFDTAWYLATYPDIKPRVINPLYHYIRYGEAEGRQPCEYFHPAWYREHHHLGSYSGLMLHHYLHEGRAAALKPNPLFDAAWYLRQNPDVSKAGADAAEHYYAHGWREGRDASANFSTNGYIATYIGHKNINPVTYALQHPHAEPLPGVQAVPAADTDAGESGQGEQGDAAAPGTALAAQPEPMQAPYGDVAEAIRYFANPGPAFEEPGKIDFSGRPSRAKTVAFYLPQFYAFDENDRWWGEGFTEWRNVSRGTPRYAGHYQPRIPRDLGFYNLTDERVLHEQARMARRNGIEAFCFYYYWFNGKRLMDKPLDLFVDAGVEQDFCIMWANENWTRTWDGFDNEVLIQQDYRDEDEDAFIEDTARYFRDPRYLRVDGRPLFIMYRPGLVPKARDVLARWREKWTAAVGVEPWILMVQGFGDTDPRAYGLDGAVEFPPHKVCEDLPEVRDRYATLDPGFSGHVRCYQQVIEKSLGEPAPEFPLIKTVVPHWDNDARRESRGYSLAGSTPAQYEHWLEGAISYAAENPFHDQPMVFVNAWNEWAEGAYLEPDVHYGHAYLNATQRAVYGRPQRSERQRFLLVGHDGHRHGAQMLLKSLAKTYTRQFGMDVTILLKQDGALVRDYQQYGRTVVLEHMGAENLPAWLEHENFDIAICNTSVTGDLVPTLKAQGIRVVSLIHELPNLVSEYGLEENLRQIAQHADNVVFPSTVVADGFRQTAPHIDADWEIRPQGTYKQVRFDAAQRNTIRRRLGLDDKARMVLNVGYADLRKGFDLFLQTARIMVARDPNLHFIWVGDLAPDMQRWVGSDIQDSGIENNIHLIGFTDSIEAYYSAADCLFLTSREDPYPTVVLEALNAGMPVVLYRGTTGFDELIPRFGHLVDRNDIAEACDAVQAAAYEEDPDARAARRQYVESECQFDDYAFHLLQRLRPDIKKTSVVVPNYNYADYIVPRLDSVFNQTQPIFEIIVLDDQSSDDSVRMIRQAALDAQRTVRLVCNGENSGNVFRQWRKGVSLCRGDFIWIAEADDLADPRFLQESLARFDENTAFSFSNSIQIGTRDELLADSYDYYYDLIDRALFSGDFNMDGQDFIEKVLAVKNAILNVSSVLWRRDVLDAALESTGDALLEHKLVGDWRLYLEALMQDGARVSYLSSSLNTHRRHQSSVTHSLDQQRHLDEIRAIHSIVNQRLAVSGRTSGAMREYITELREQFGLQDEAREAA